LVLAFSVGVGLCPFFSFFTICGSSGNRVGNAG
jgi:hypothetical protein